MKFLIIFCQVVTVCLEFPSKSMQWLLPKLLRHINFTLSDKELSEMRIEYTILGVFTYYTIIAVVAAIIAVCKMSFPTLWFAQATVLWGYLVILMAGVYSSFFIFSGTD